MTTTKITRDYRFNVAKQVYESIIDSPNTAYYIFASKNTPYSGGDGVVPDSVDTDDERASLYREMAFGKRITQDDISYVIPRYDWNGNTIYTEYTSNDETMYLEPFYTIVNAASYYHIWKCLDNAGGSLATVEPSIDALSSNDDFYQTSDGYQWRYMTSVPSNSVSKFATSDFFPLVANASVTASAVDGSINVIRVIDGGNNYSNYLAGNNQFTSAQLRVGGNNTLYDISSNTTAASSNDYYNGCYIYINSGSVGEIGQYKKIIDYVVNSTSKCIILDTPFANAVTMTAEFDIYPGVIITGTGSETSNAVARAIVNASGNVIQSVQIFSTGAGYEQASAAVYSFPDVGANSATLAVVNSPPGGHGFDPFAELGSSALAVSVSFSNNEANTILQSNDYRKVGIMKDPEFTQVDLITTAVSGLFINGEDVVKIQPILLGRDGVVNATSTTFSSSSGDFTNQFSSGDQIYLYDSTLPASWLATVGSVTNSTSLTLTANAGFTSGSARFYIPRATSNGTLLAANSTVVSLSKFSGEVVTGDFMIGVDSGATFNVSTVTRSGVAKGFDTFIGAYKYVGTITSGSFQDDETVYQDSISTANGIFHSTVNDGTHDNVYVVDQFGTFAVGKTIRGATSNALFTVSAVYGPEVVFNSGEVLYVENLNPVTRAPDQSETFKLVFEF